MAEPAMPSYQPWWSRSKPEPLPAPEAYPPQPDVTPPVAAQPVRAPVRRASAPPRPTSQAGKAVQRYSGMRVGVRPPFTPSDSGKPLKCENKTQTGGRVKVVCE
ncbi:MAG: hypothetical protein QM744_11790 [Mesorhizobium sp.]